MKISLVLLLIFTACNLFATPSKQVEKWKLFSQLDEITDELNANEHTDKQVDTSLAILRNTLNTLRGTTPNLSLIHI